jgi:hypothetical protein
MAKDQPALNAEAVNTAANELVLRGESQQGITWGQAFDFAEGQETEKMKALTGAEWLKLENFGQFTFAFMGMDTAETEDGTVEVVKLSDRDGKEWISSLAVLLSVCKKLTTIPTFIKILYEQDKKGANGKYKDLKIYAL